MPVNIYKKIAVYSCAHVAHSRKIPINPSGSQTLKKTHYFTANSFYKQPVNIHAQRH